MKLVSPKCYRICLLFQYKNIKFSIFLFNNRDHIAYSNLNVPFEKFGNFK